jgi:hypothetical protein
MFVSRISIFSLILKEMTLFITHPLWSNDESVKYEIMKTGLLEIELQRAKNKL